LVACIVAIIIDALVSGHRNCVRPGKMEAIVSIFWTFQLASTEIHPSIHWQSSIRPSFELRKAPTAHTRSVCFGLDN
ncbi:hypothetical protein T4E_5353, partial [Trichinella pseudospiralis]